MINLQLEMKKQCEMCAITNLNPQRSSHFLQIFNQSVFYVYSQQSDITLPPPPPPPTKQQQTVSYTNLPTGPHAISLTIEIMSIIQIKYLLHNCYTSIKRN